MFNRAEITVEGFEVAKVSKEEQSNLDPALSTSRGLRERRNQFEANPPVMLTSNNQ